jgi:hypothetical protein
MQDRPMQRMASALRDDATMPERIDHLRRNYTLDHGTRLWAGEMLRDAADDLRFMSEVAHAWADIIDEAELDPPFAPPAVLSPPVAARAPAVARPRHPSPPAVPRS